MFTIFVIQLSTKMQQGTEYDSQKTLANIDTKMYFSNRNEIIVLANTFDDSDDADWSRWFIFDPYLAIWTKQNLPKEVSFPTKPNWFFIPILGELHLFLPKHTLRYHSETTSWTSIDLNIDLSIENVGFLQIGFIK